MPFVHSFDFIQGIVELFEQFIYHYCDILTHHQRCYLCFVSIKIRCLKFNNKVDHMVQITIVKTNFPRDGL